MSRNISMTAELLGDNRSHDAFMEMSADIKVIDKQLDDLERDIKIGLRLDDKASAEIKTADASLDRWDGREATATIALKDKASGNLRYAFSYLDSWGETEATATIRLKDDATRPIRLAAAHLSAWDGDEATATLKVSDRASAGIKNASGELKRFDGEDATATLNAQDRATQKIAGAVRAGTAFDRLNPTADVDADTSGASAGFAKTTAEATAVGRLNPTVDVDVDTGAATAQLVAFSGTAVGTTAATSALTKSMIGLTSPLALGGVVAAGVAAAAAVGPLAAGLAVAGTAGVAAAAGFGLLAGAIAPSIMQIQKFKEAQDGQEAATKAAAASVKTYESAQESLAAAQRGVVNAERGVAEARRSAAQQTSSAIDAYKSSLQDVEEAARGVQEAERGVAEARRSAAQSVKSATDAYADSLEGVEDAEESLEDSRRSLRSATQDVVSAQEDLNEALEDEPRNMAQLELGVKEARLQQAQATEDVAEAQRDLNEARKKGNPAEVRQAELDLRAARLSTERASLDEKEAEDDLSDARKKGTSELQAAREGYKSSLEARRSAARGVTDSEEALADSQKAASRAEKDIQRARTEGARSIREAQRGVSEAQRALADSQRAAAAAEKAISRARADGARQVRESQRAVSEAQRAAARAADEVADAAKEMAAKEREAAAAGGILSAANRKLYDSYKALKPAFKDAFGGANKEAAEFGAELLDLTKKPLPALGREAKETVGSVRREFKGLRGDLGGREKDSLLKILDSTSDIFGDLTRAGGRVFGGVANVLAEIVPDAKDFSRYLSDVSEDFLKWSRSEKAREQIHDWLKNAKPLFSELADSAGDFIGFLISFGNKYGDELAEGLDLVSDSVSALFGKKENDERKKDAGAAGAMTGSAYSTKFVEAQDKAAKKKGPGLGKRWGTTIGKAANDLFLGILGGGGQDGATKFVDGFLKGINKEKITGAEFRKALTGTANPDWQDWIFGSKAKFKFEGSPIDNMMEAVDKRFDKWIKNLAKFGERVTDEITSPFQDAYDKIVGNSIVPDLVDDVTKVFSRLPGRIVKGIKEIPGNVGDIFQDAWKKGSGYLGDLAKSADEKTRDAQKWITSHLSEGRKKGLEELGVLNKDGTADFDGLRKAADEKMDSARGFIKDHLEAGRDKGRAALESLKKDGLPDLDDLRKGADEKTDQARQAIKDHLETARDVGKSALETLRDKGGEAMSEARDRWTDPVKGSSADQQGFMNNMLYGMGQVIEKAGLDLKKPEPFKVETSPAAGRGAGMTGRYGMAEGGVATVGGVRQLADGGDVFARGGDLRGPRQPRLIEVGEGDHDEAVIAITKNPALRSNQEHYMKVGADLIGGAFLSAAEVEAQRIKSFAEGGIVDLGGGMAVRVPKRQPGTAGTTEPGSAEERLFGRRWATYGASGGSGLPPLGNFGPFFGSDGILRYQATPEAAPLARAGAAMWKGQVQPGSGGSQVSMGELGGATRGMAYSSGKIILDYAAKEIAAAHEFGHHFKLGHGGDSIMGGAGEVTANDFAALKKYHGIAPGGSGGGPGTAGTGTTGGFGSGSGSSGGYDQGPDSGRAQRMFDRYWDRTTGAMPGWMSGIFEMAEGGVLAGESADGTPSGAVPVARFAGGGTWYKHVADANAEAAKKWPSLTIQPGTPGADGDPGNSTDFYPGAIGEDVSGEKERVGDEVVAWLESAKKSITDYIIWNGMANYGGGWEPYTGGAGYPTPVTVNDKHLDHAHWEATKGTGSSSYGGGLYSGTAAGIDIKPLVDKHIKQVPDWGKGLPPDSAEGIAKTARAAIVKRLEAEASKMSGGEWSGGGDLDKWITDGFKFGNAFEDTPDNHAKMKARAMQESGGDPNAVNNYDSNAQAGTPSKGVVQVIEPEWKLRQTQYGDDAGPFDDNWMNPVKSVGIGSRRMKAVYGEVLGDTGQGYKGGGLIREDHAAMVHKDELYFPIGEDPRAATEFMGFLKNLAPRGADSPGMRQEYERRIADFEGRGDPGGPRPGAGGGFGDDGRGGAVSRRDANRMVEDAIKRSDEAADRRADRLVAAVLASGVDEERAEMIADRLGGGMDDRQRNNPEAQRAVKDGQDRLDDGLDMAGSRGFDNGPRGGRRRRR